MFISLLIFIQSKVGSTSLRIHYEEQCAAVEFRYKLTLHFARSCVLVYSLQLLDIVLLYPIGLPEKDCLFIHKNLQLTGETTYQTVVILYSNGKSQGSGKSVRTHERNLLVHGEYWGRREGTHKRLFGG